MGVNFVVRCSRMPFVGLALAFALVAMWAVPGSAAADEDTTPPKVLETAIEPASIDSSGSERTVTVIAHLSDDISGVNNAYALFSSPSNKQGTVGIFERISGNASDGTYKAVVPFKQFAETGTWKLSINYYDLAGNFGETGSKQLAEEGQPNSVVVEGGESKDTAAPQIDELSFEPAKVDTGESAQSVTVTAHITDATGFGKGYVVLRSAGERGKVFGEFERISGDANSGLYRAKIQIERYSQNGAWGAEIFSADLVGNSRDLSPADLEAAGLPRGIQVEGQEDTQPPQLQGLVIKPGEIDTSQSEQSVTVAAHVTDDLAGTNAVSIEFRSPGGSDYTFASLSRVSGDDKDGVYEGSVPFKRFSQPGVWKVSFVSIGDRVVNYANFDAEQLQELGFPSSVQILEGKEEGSEDSQPPQLHSLAIKPSEVDTTGSDQIVAVTAHLSDDVSGLESGAANLITLVSPEGNQETYASLTRVSGTDLDGTFEGNLTFRRFCQSGTWEVKSLRIEDRNGHRVTFGPGQLQELGFPREVQVKDEKEDTQAPQLQSLSVEPGAIHAGSKESVTVTAHLTDNLAGLDTGAVNMATFYPPEGEGEARSTLTRVSGTDSDGIFEATLPAGYFGRIGTWPLNVRITDRVGNYANFNAEQLQKNGFPSSVQILEAEEEPKDTTPPQIDELSFKPGEIDTSTSAQTVIVTAHVTDAGSGFGKGEVSFTSPSGKSGTGGAFELIAGNPANGSYQAKVPFEQLSEAGSWDATVVLADATGNSVKRSSADLQEAGLPHAVQVAEVTTGPLVTLSSSPNPSVRGQKVTFTAKVTPSAPESPTPIGTVAFVEGTTTLGVVNLNKGTATFNTTALGAGKHPVVAHYGGDANYGPAESEPLTQVVAKASTQLTLTSSLNPAPFGSAGTVKATVKAVAPGAGTPAGTITFREGPTVLATVQLAGASATYSLKTMTVGGHEITATYNGDPNYEPSEASPLTQAITRAKTEMTLTSTINPAPYGSSATLKATVDALAPSVATPPGTVTFREGETVLATVPLSNGVAKYALKTTPPGEYEITASFGGSEEFEASEATIAQVVTRAATETTLTSTLNPAPYGSSGTLKATVKAVAPGAGTPPGTVTFREGTTVLATVPLSGSTAKLALKSLAPGSHEITATYNGDTNYEPSEAGIAQMITPASTELTLTSSKNPAPLGSSGNLKATVKAVAPGAGTPTGTVTFREGEAVLATIPLSSGSGTYPLKSLAIGTHEITATYSGSGNYEPSIGSITQVITP